MHDLNSKIAVGGDGTKDKENLHSAWVVNIT